jgi:group I intron endonuclease
MQILESNTKSCIYCILNCNTGMLYFGQTRNFSKRSLEHKNDLKANRHCNSWLQRLFNKENLFMIFPVEKCDIDKLNEKEIFWISYHDSSNRVNGYNLSKGGTNSILWSPEVIKKRADKRRGNPGSLKGRPQTEEHKKARSLATKGISKPMLESTLVNVRASRLLKKGTRQKGKIVTVTDCNTNENLIFNSKREVEDFLNLTRDTLIHKFYYGKPRQILKTITFNNYIITR